MDSNIQILWQDRKRNIFGLPWTFTKYSLSEDRLFIKTGLLKTVEIFRIGTIEVSSGDTTMGNFELKNIRDVSEVKEKLSQLVEENREKKRVANREYINGNEDLDVLD